MSKRLTARLREAEREFEKIDEIIASSHRSPPGEVKLQFEKIGAFKTDIKYSIGLLEARAAAFSLLQSLPDQANPDDIVPFGKGSAKFEHVRLIGVQGYLTIKWALADRLTKIAAHALCVRGSLNNPQSPPQLVSHFIANKGPEKQIAAVAFYSIRHSFGWPIVISYALRNHFVHDGGQLDGATFFEGPTAAAGFNISTQGWEHIEKRVQAHGVTSLDSHLGSAWRPEAGSDLRNILKVCEQATDDALGILIGSAHRLASAHLGLLLDEDR